MRNKKAHLAIVLGCTIAAILLVCVLAFANAQKPPQKTLTKNIPDVELSSSTSGEISLGKKQQNSNQENKITKNQEKKETKEEKNNKNIEDENNEDNQQNQSQQPEKQDSEEEYTDLAEDAYAESSIQIDDLMKEMGLNSKDQIIYAKAITGAGKETLLQAANGLYSIFLSTQGTTIVQIKYKDKNGDIQTYIKKINYVRPEGSTPEKKRPIINTTLKDQAVYTNNTLNFDLWVTNYRGKPLAYNNLEVYVNGQKASYIGQMDMQTYRTTLKTGANTIKIKVTDTYQYTVTREYTVYYKSGKGRITISLEAGTIGIKYLIKPQKMDVESGEALSQVVVDFLKANGIECEYAGTIDDGFYLSKITKKNLIKGHKIPGDLISKINQDGLIFDKTNYESKNCLGEFDFCQGSGWMYSINNIYSSYGFDKAYVQNGDRVRIRYTLAYGKDIGGASVSEGMYGTLKNYGKEW